MSASFNNFSIEVEAFSAEHFTRDGANYVNIAHKSNFKLRLSNNRGTIADAQIFIENVDNGVFRIPAYDNIIIERPSNKSQLFMALEEGTKESVSADIKTGDNLNGLISVVFTPEILKVRAKKSYIVEKTCCEEREEESYEEQQEVTFSLSDYTPPESVNMRGVGIALGGESLQKFESIAKIVHIDHSNITTIKLRLVTATPTPYKSIRSIPADPPRLD